MVQFIPPISAFAGLLSIGVISGGVTYITAYLQKSDNLKLRGGVILSISKETMSLGVPWEKEYGYSQAVKVGDTIYVSGQVAHNDNSKIVGSGYMKAQMRQAYSNIHKVLAQYGATMDNIVDEILFATDMDSAFSAAIECRNEVFFGAPVVASTIVQIQHLAFPDLVI